MCRPERAGVRAAGVALVAVLAVAITACSRSNARTHLDAGNHYFDTAKFPEAVIEYRNALQIDGDSADAHRMLAQTYARMRQRDEAAREWVRAADLLPRDTDLQLKAAVALLEVRQFTQAQRRVEMVLGREPSHVGARILLGYALAGLQRLDDAVAQLEGGMPDGGSARAYVNLGMLQLAGGHRDEAERAFSSALLLAPKSVDARLAMAQWYWATSRAADAEATVKTALDLDPKHVRAHWLLAAMYMATHREADAERPFEDAAEAGAGAVPRLVLADYYTAMGRTADALRILEPLAARDGSFSEATRRMAVVEQMAGHPARARTLIERLLSREPQNVAALTVKARLLIDERHFDDALSSLRSAMSAAPSSEDAQHLLGDAYLATGDIDKAIATFADVLKRNPGAAAARTELAGAYLYSGNSESAIRELCRVLDADRGNASARLMLVRAFIARADLDAADVEARTLVADNAGAEAQTLLGTVALLRGRLDQARGAFARAADLDPASLDATAGLVTVSLRSKAPAEARRLVDARLAKRPVGANLLLLAANTYAALGDAEGSERLFRRTLETDPGNLQAYEQLGRLYIAQHRLRDAQDQFDALAARRPRSVYAQTMLAALLQAQEQPAEARKRYERVIALDPRAGIAANNLAWLYAESGENLDVAVRLAQLALSQMGDRPEASDTLGWIYCKKGWFGDAIPLLKVSVDLDPARAVYHYHLGVAYAESGDVPNARRAFERALQRNPAMADARKALARLAVS